MKKWLSMPKNRKNINFEASSNHWVRSSLPLHLDNRRKPCKNHYSLSYCFLSPFMLDILRFRNYLVASTNVSFRVACAFP